MFLEVFDLKIFGLGIAGSIVLGLIVGVVYMLLRNGKKKKAMLLAKEKNYSASIQLLNDVRKSKPISQFELSDIHITLASIYLVISDEEQFLDNIKKITCNKFFTMKSFWESLYYFEKNDLVNYQKAKENISKNFNSNNKLKLEDKSRLSSYLYVLKVLEEKDNPQREELLKKIHQQLETCGFLIRECILKIVKELKQNKEEKYSLTFRKPNIDDASEITAFKQEFIQNNSGMDGTGILVKVSAEEWLKFNKDMETTTHPNYSKSLQYGLFNQENRLLGLIQIRLELKGYLIEFGGHIGYCVRPSERRKGYAKTMLKQALDVCKKMGLDKVLITCLESNSPSAKTIEACGGIFERMVFDDQNYQSSLKRYWIKL